MMIDIIWSDRYVLPADNIRTNTIVYRRQIGPHIFYRLVTGIGDNTDFSDANVPFLQSPLYRRNGENVLLAIATYNSYEVGQYNAIFTVPEYKIAYVNDKAFDWGAAPHRTISGSASGLIRKGIVAGCCAGERTMIP
jgi:hypothetical protein